MSRPSSAAATSPAAAASSAAAMGDEYGAMNAEGSTFVVPRFELESGEVLSEAQVRYRTYGALNSARTNVMVVCHALTGNAALESWWGDMLGPGKLFDTNQFLVVCCNVLGSCYGTTGPTTINPATKEAYGVHDFPDVTVRDSVNLHALMLREVYRAESVACVVGGSLGGMQALEWALCTPPGYVKSVVTMCCGASHSPWQIGISEAQRQAIYADPKWRNGRYPADDPPKSGLSVARQFAMITYRSAEAYAAKFGRQEIPVHSAGHGQKRYFEVESYLRHQGAKFPERFDASSYVVLTRLMDTHDVGRGRGGIAKALRRLTCPVLIISVDSDALYPPADQKELFRLLPNAEYAMIHSDSGHDGFLLDQDDVESLTRSFFVKHGIADHRPGGACAQEGGPARAATAGGRTPPSAKL